MTTTNRQTPRVPHVRGDTISWGGTIDGLAAGTWTAASKVQTQDGLITAVLVCTLTAPVNPGDPYTFLLTGPAVDQSTWPAAPMLADIKISEASSGTVLHTCLFFVDVSTPVT